jgi:hypothetical protein
MNQFVRNNWFRFMFLTFILRFGSGSGLAKVCCMAFGLWFGSKPYAEKTKRAVLLPFQLMFRLILFSL